MYGRDIKKSHGAILNENNEVIAETLMCPHCGLPFIKKFNKQKFKLVNPGGHVKSLCLICGGEICGRKRCSFTVGQHIAFEQRQEILEKGVVV